ncbi:MAG: polymerase, partial [Treponema sp.]|nr:polymerase [Treponema sp.]
MSWKRLREVRQGMRRGCITGALIWIAAVAGGQTRIDISGMIEWERMELNATVTLNLAAAGIKLPTGRSQAEEIIDIEYVNLILPSILAIPVDSSDNIDDLISRGEFPLRLPSFIAGAARKVPPALSTDLASLSVSYTIDLTTISSRIIRHSRAMELPRPLTPVPSAEYTGIIIIANEEMPVHGRNSTALAEPCLFPKVWDTDMNLVYERNVLDPANLEKNA